MGCEEDRNEQTGNERNATTEPKTSVQIPLTSHIYKETFTPVSMFGLYVPLVWLLLNYT